MNEYISKEYIRNIVQKYWDGACEDGELFAFGRVLDEIDDAPVTDVIEVKHGKWIPVHHNGKFTGGKCSVCGKFKKTYNMGTLYNGYKFCHRCGAKMK